MDPIKPKNIEKKEQTLGDEEPIKQPPEIKRGNDLGKLHPELSSLYKDLNEIIYDSLLMGNRSRDMQRTYEIKIEQQRKKIKEYCKEHNITRDDLIK
jgi:hypothetical protein